MREGAKIIVRAIRAEIDGLDLSTSGKRKLKRAIRIRPFRNQKGKPYAMAVRLYRVTGKPDTDPFWSHWINYGTANRYRATPYYSSRVTRSISTGKIKGQPFIENAISASINEAATVVEQAAAQKLQVTIDELAGK